MEMKAKKGIVLKDEFVTSLIHNKEKQTIRKEALFSLLLYDKIWTSSRFNFSDTTNGNILLSEDLVEPIPKIFFKKNQDRIHNIVKEIEEINHSIAGIKPIGFSVEGEILADNRRRAEIENIEYYERLTNNTIGLFQDFLWDSYLIKRGPNAMNNIPSNILPNYPSSFYKNIDISISYIESCGWDGIYFDRIEEEMKYINTLYDEKLDKFLLEKKITIKKKHRIDKIELYRNKIERDFLNEFELDDERFYFIIEYLKLKELLDFSEKNQIPIKYSIQNINPKNRGEIVKSDSSYQVYKIILDEIQYMPVLNSIEDVLRLRNDKRINRFRETIKNWTFVISSGDSSQENKVRGDIRKANVELKNLSKYQRINGWTTYFALPFIIIDLLSGVPIGSILTAISGAYELKSDLLKKKHSWLLLGRNY